MPGRLSGSSIHLFYILRHKVFSDCMGISVEVEDYAWIRRIVENLARSSSDCVVISGEVEACTRICRTVWREVKVVGGGRRAVGLAFLEDEQTENIFLRIENFVDCLSLR